MSEAVALLALDAIVSARVGIEPVSFGPVPWEELGEGFVAAASAHRVTSLAATSPLAANLPAAVRSSLGRCHRASALRVMLQMTQTSEILALFRSAGLDVLVMKGHIFSEVAYQDPLVRGVSADLDLLVAPQAVSTAHELLSAAGYRCATDCGHRPPVHGWRGSYSSWVHHERSYRAADRLGVDLHWRPLPTTEESSQFEAVWADRVEVDFNGGKVVCPSPQMNEMVAAGQGIGDGWPTLRSVVDFVVARALAGGNREHRPVTVDRLMQVAAMESEFARTRHLVGRETPSGPLRRQWKLRRTCNRPASAAVRAGLASLLPARRLMSKAPDSPALVT